MSAIGKSIGPEGTRSEEDADPIYPPKLWEPYRTRRFQLGEAMYALLGIGREDRPGRLARLGRNFEVFGAPVGTGVTSTGGMATQTPAEKMFL